MSASEDEQTYVGEPGYQSETQMGRVIQVLNEEDPRGYRQNLVDMLQESDQYSEQELEEAKEAYMVADHFFGDKNGMSSTEKLEVLKSRFGGEEY